MREYQVCSNCVMDTTDTQIEFDAHGVCDHCRGFKEHVLPKWHPDDTGREMLRRTVEQIREHGKGREFDCIIGMSGGLDSSYMLHLVVTEFGLRPLVFHVDGGWNTDIAVNNIQVLVEKLGLDLYTEVINWQEMRDFQLAFFKSGVPHIDIPQDHAFVATLYKFANKHGIKYILNGGNISTECVRNPLEWLYHGTDMAQINDIRRRFSTVEMPTYPFSNIFFHKFYLRYIRGLRVVKPLDWLPYTKAHAQQTLADSYGWKAYPQKHFESRFTRFFEGYWLPERFGYDTRKVQYSSLILTGQMTREDAIEKLKIPAYDPETIQHEFDFIARKLEVSSEELRGYFTMEKKTFRDYKNQEWIFQTGSRLLQMIGAEKAVKR
ncbi:N-acetyl sugar amidotransferase [Nostoc ellipsosporum NOK]|uniref:N-acetyl sugar amidotransferase n=1 Tax=Sphingomonas sp. IBVSS2 TaxID=1985172 RepID=UPI000A2EBA38|nr:N-acetyl sugar amidotransferase [Sphingomonas sp. IBVSS2]MDF2384382.1 N-acetyl sugar amidotransferase [Nostoc ellipsosporum NOK]OSZ68486.1 LPS biosynthesis protein [Sphingomonas sp. IBVSS2]